MTQRGRKSAAQLETPAPSGGEGQVVDIKAKGHGTGLTAPAHLPAGAKQVWDGLVRAMGPGYFIGGDSPLLEAYCCTAALHKTAVALLHKEGPVDRTCTKPHPHPAIVAAASLAASMAFLAVRLRLSPSSRYTEKAKAAQGAAGTDEGDGSPTERPWE